LLKITMNSPMTCSGKPFGAVDVDLVVVPWCETDGPDAVAGVDGATGGELARALGAKEFCAHACEMFPVAVVDPSWRAGRLLLVGAGKREAFGSDVLRRLGTAAGLWAKQRRLSRVGFVAWERGFNAEEMAQAAAEGLTLAEFDGGRYKTGDDLALTAPVWT